MTVKTLQDLLDEGVEGRGVLVRSDLNVPLDNGVITDPGRIIASVPTISKLVEAGGKVAMIGAPWDTLTLLHHAEHLARLPGKRVRRYEVPLATADGVSSRSRPAAEKLPCSTTAVNSESALARSAPMPSFASKTKILCV